MAAAAAGTMKAPITTQKKGPSSILTRFMAPVSRDQFNYRLAPVYTLLGIFPYRELR